MSTLIPLWQILALLAVAVIVSSAHGWAADQYEFRWSGFTRRWYGTRAHVCLRAEEDDDDAERYTVIAWDDEGTDVPWLLVEAMDDDWTAHWAPVTDFAPYTVRLLARTSCGPSITASRSCSTTGRCGSLTASWGACAMLPDLFAGLGLLLVAAFAAVLFVPRLLRSRHPAEQAGTAAVSPERPSPASGGMAAPVITVRPSSVMTEPFAYDNGLTVESGEKS